MMNHPDRKQLRFRALADRAAFTLRRVFKEDSPLRRLAKFLSSLLLALRFFSGTPFLDMIEQLIFAGQTIEVEADHLKGSLGRT